MSIEKEVDLISIKLLFGSPLQQCRKLNATFPIFLLLATSSATERIEAAVVAGGIGQIYMRGGLPPIREAGMCAWSSMVLTALSDKQRFPWTRRPAEIARRVRETIEDEL